MVTISTEDPVAVSVVTAIRAGDLAALRGLLVENPWLATARLGDQRWCTHHSSAAIAPCRERPAPIVWPRLDRWRQSETDIAGNHFRTESRSRLLSVVPGVWVPTVVGMAQAGETVDERRHPVDSPGSGIQELDALRGFALCGILIVNIYQQVVFRRDGTGAAGEYPLFVELAFQERFLPVFAILFGTGFGIFLRRAATRTGRPRVVLARRLLVLLVIGIVHYVFHPGEVLTAYAVFGLLVLLPLSYLRGWTALAVAIVLLALGSQIVVGYGPIPGLLALGYALAVLRVPEALPRAAGGVAVGFVALGVLATSWVGLVLAVADLPRVNVIGGLGDRGQPAAPGRGDRHGAGLLLRAAAPAAHPGRAGVVCVLAPMGRMALTNYLTATALFLIAGPPIGIDSAEDLPRIVALTIGILLVQAVWSRVWLRYFRYGPSEWLWRCLTWWQLASICRVR